MYVSRDQISTKNLILRLDIPILLALGHSRLFLRRRSLLGVLLLAHVVPGTENGMREHQRHPDGHGEEEVPYAVVGHKPEADDAE